MQWVWLISAKEEEDAVSSLLRSSSSSNTKMIIDGNVTEEGRYPYMVSIANSNMEHICGGVLVDAYFVLTERECYGFANFRPKFARIGLYDITNFTFTETIEIVDQTIHPRALLHPLAWVPNLFARKDYNVMMLELKYRANSTDPIAYATDYDGSGWVNNYVDKDVTVLGWGTGNIVAQPDEYSKSNKLREATLKIIPYARCQIPYMMVLRRITPRMQCTYNGLKGVCYGDRGAPLLILGDSNRTDLLVGISSFTGCGFLKYLFPSVFTRVDAIADFIQCMVERREDDNDFFALGFACLPL